MNQKEMTENNQVIMKELLKTTTKCLGPTVIDTQEVVIPLVEILYIDRIVTNKNENDFSATFFMALKSLQRDDCLHKRGVYITVRGKDEKEAYVRAERERERVYYKWDAHLKEIFVASQILVGLSEKSIDFLESLR